MLVSVTRRGTVMLKRVLAPVLVTRRNALWRLLGRVPVACEVSLAYFVNARNS